MGNVVNVCGNVPIEKTIKEMRPGEVGYTVEWAFDPEHNNLNEDYTVIDEPQGTAHVLVECVSQGKYKLTFPLL